MFETAKKYSEHAYYSKADLEKEMDHYLIDPLWHEIVQYRSFFQQDFPLQKKKTYLIRNPHVNDAMAYTQEMIFSWMSLHQEQTDTNVDMFWLRDDEQLRFSRLYVKMRYDHAIHPHMLFQEIYDGFHLQKKIDHSLCQYLENASHNLLLKIFLLIMECDKRCAFLLWFPVLYLHHCLPLSQLFTMEELIDNVDHNITNLDVTSNFLSLLSYLRLKFSDDMISLSMKKDTSPMDMGADELIERYPMLQKESILFYVNHRKLHHYYTLQEYMQYANVCYETARYSMEKLVELKWYQKQKIGKKFVYFIM